MKTRAFLFSRSNALRTAYIIAALLLFMLWRGNGADPVGIVIVAVLTFFVLNPVLEAAAGWVRRAPE